MRDLEGWGAGKADEEPKQPRRRHEKIRRELFVFARVVADRSVGYWDGMGGEAFGERSSRRRKKKKVIETDRRTSKQRD